MRKSVKYNAHEIFKIRNYEVRFCFIHEVFHYQNITLRHLINFFENQSWR